MIPAKGFAQRMTPRQKIAELYWRYPQPRAFDTDERLYRISGYVLEGDDHLLIGRAVDHLADQDLILDPKVVFPYSQQTGWFIWAFVGPMWKIFDLAPYPLPYVGWVRRNGPLHFYDVNDLIPRCAQDQNHVQLLIGSWKKSLYPMDVGAGLDHSISEDTPK